MTDELMFRTVRYAPPPFTGLRSRDGLLCAGDLLFEGEPQLQRDVHALRVIEVVRALRVATGPRAAALRSEIRTLAVECPRVVGESFDVRWLTGLTALEGLRVYSFTGIIGAGALAELPLLRHAELFASRQEEPSADRYDRDRHLARGILDLEGIARSRSLEVLHFRGGGLGDLRALSGLATLRRLAVHEHQPLSTTGLEDLPLESLELALPEEGNDLTALTTLRALRSLSFSGRLSATAARVIARCRVPILSLSGTEDDADPALVTALPDAEELRLKLPSLDRYSQTSRLSVTSLEVGSVDDAALRLLARAPRLRTLDITWLTATDLAPIADLPKLCALGFVYARQLRSLDRVPTAVFLGYRSPTDVPIELVLKDSPLASIRQLGHLRGVEHLDLSGCTQLTSLWGLEGMDELRSIDLRGCSRLVDMSSLEALPALRKVLADKQGPLEPFPPSLWSRVDWSNRRKRR
ncbi:leucine-rich repeat domain-containing protein [Pyxidicoccus xibeiensis]|uniref:leucine-rich repeat domain-containing protein n=1 Tax=Pyxidicoccus xibeiensis TaxID=2906759 RepID=UPI0020A7D707|nr:hypothetical protein [Pyxidicoccus xibeiensis]MCP3138351.1 hypothetical protein [Pyxidicoccus xibeiensis]